jgi:hypothetical protein
MSAALLSPARLLRSRSTNPERLLTSERGWTYCHSRRGRRKPDGCGSAAPCGLRRGTHHGRRGIPSALRPATAIEKGLTGAWDRNVLTFAVPPRSARSNLGVGVADIEGDSGRSLASGCATDQRYWPIRYSSRSDQCPIRIGWREAAFPSATAWNVTSTAESLHASLPHATSHAGTTRASDGGSASSTGPTRLSRARQARTHFSKRR